MVAANFFGPGAPTTADMALLISAAITPQDSANILIFDFFASGSCDSPPDYPLIAIFQSGVANAIFANNQGVANAQYTFSPKYYMTAGTTSATTFSVYHSSFFGAATTAHIAFYRLPVWPRRHAISLSVNAPWRNRPGECRRVPAGLKASS